MRFALLTLALLSSSMSASDLDRYRWKSRLLVIEAPSIEDDSYRTQAGRLMASWQGLLERDLVIETRFGREGFATILIGKDGGEKLRRSEPVDTAELFALIDGMPMRRAEMRSGRP